MYSGLIAIRCGQLGCGCRAVVDEFYRNGDRLVQNVFKLDRVVGLVAGRGDLLGRNGLVLELIACPRRRRYGQLHVLKRGDLIALERLAVADGVDRDGRVAVGVVLAIPECNFRIRIAHIKGRRVESRDCGVVLHCSNRIAEIIRLASGHVIDLLLCAVDLLAAVNVFLDDGQLVLIAGIGVGDGHIILAVVITVNVVRDCAVDVIQRVIRNCAKYRSCVVLAILDRAAVFTVTVLEDKISLLSASLATYVTLPLECR